jgi:uncharacterized membrane protein AbrB (regulator of aidB expression)
VYAGGEEVDTFWTLFKENVIIQALLALMFGATICYMYIAQLGVPMELVALVSVIIGYFFGSKTQQAVLKSQATRAVD